MKVLKSWNLHGQCISVIYTLFPYKNFSLLFCMEYAKNATESNDLQAYSKMERMP